MACTETDISTCWRPVQRKKIGFRMDCILRADLGLGEFDGRSGSRVARNTKPSRVFRDNLSIFSFTDQVKQVTNTATSVCFKSRGHFCLSNHDNQQMLHFSSYVFIMWICAVILLNIVNTFSTV